MALRTSADNAEDVAAGFRMFREPLPEHATEITRLMADLYAIISSLKDLEDLTKNPLYRHNLPVAWPDLELVCASLKYTLEDIVDFFGDLEAHPGSSRGIYKQTWLELCSFFRGQSRDSLATRLAKYKAFLNEVEDLIQDKGPDAHLMAELRDGIQYLLVEQENRLVPRFGDMSLDGQLSSSSNSAGPASPVGDRRPPNRGSFERARPPHISPQSPLSPSSGTFSSDYPPSAPDAPGSSLPSSITSQSMTSGIIGHWAKKVFSDNHSATPIRQVRESSKCFGEPLGGVRTWLIEGGFEELFQLAFNDGSGLRVYLYLREEDHRARIVCKASHSSRPSDYFCLPLNMLEVIRNGPCLQLCRRRRSGSELVLWANLKFATIERMVLFFCTFLALRSQDCGRPVERIRDYELDEEKELFGGQIVDDSYLHALRVYRDALTGAVRLQASVHKGEMKRAPVWTAFITHSINSRAWMRRVDSRVVLLRELQRTVFTFTDYTPPRTARGEHILKFTSRSDAQEFMETIAELADSG